MLTRALVLLATLSVISGAPQQFRQQRGYATSNTTPVPILRQINTHNDDGSYTYGYEGGDGSYKIENKAANGVVTGKYGYYDDQGQLREIEYGANKNGFVPTGTGINVPPPSANSISNAAQYSSQGPDDQDDGQYRPDQHETPYQYQPELNPLDPNAGQGFNYAPQQQQQQFQNQPIFQQRKPARARSLNRNRTNQQRQQNYYQAPAQQQNYYQAPAQQQYTAPVFQPQQPNNANLFQGHPASNINLNSGSYSINY